MSGNEMKILIFDLNGEYYAIDILEVERILRFKNATEMPEAPHFVEGIVNYEDDILPIINLSKKFKLPVKEKGEKSKIIVIKKDENKFGVVVDNVFGVTAVHSEAFQEAPTVTTSILNKYIKGLFRIKENIVILLEITKLLSTEEEDMIF